ncbi:MAG: DUF4129 domain-containing protein [Lachnospiraceae bacterium]|nr:DUF4129 domain-containing protein [Lachnospiraceae bacterium]
MVTAKNRVLWCLLRSMEAAMQILLFFVVLLMASCQFISRNLWGIGKCFLLAALPVLVLYLTRLWAQNNVLILLTHIFVAVLVVTRGSTGDEIFAYIILSVSLLVFSLSIGGVAIKRDSATKRNSAEKLPLGFVCLFVVAMVLGRQMEFVQLESIGMYGGALFIILQILYMNFDSVNKYIVLNQGIANLPVKQIVWVNSFQMSVLVILFCGVTYLFGNSYVGRMVESISGFLGSVMKCLLRLLFSFGKDGRTKVYVPDESFGGGRGMQELWAIVEDTIWRDILNGIGMIFGSVVGSISIIGLSALLLVLIIKKLKSMSFGGESDIKEFMVPTDVIEFFVSPKKKTEEEEARGLNRKVRKLYKSYVKKRAVQKQGMVKGTMLPAEISETYVEKETVRVTEIYEKARYGSEPVSAEEWKRLKEILK